MENINNVPTGTPDNASAQSASLNRTNPFEASEDMSQKGVYITHVSNFDLGTYMIILSSALGIIAFLFANIPVIGSYGTTPAILGAILGVVSILVCWRNKTQMLVSVMTMFISVWAIQTSMTNLDRSREAIVKFSSEVVEGVGNTVNKTVEGVGDTVNKTVDKVIDNTVKKLYDSTVGESVKSLNEVINWAEKIFK